MNASRNMISLRLFTFGMMMVVAQSQSSRTHVSSMSSTANRHEYHRGLGKDDFDSNVPSFPKEINCKNTKETQSGSYNSIVDMTYYYSVNFIDDGNPAELFDDLDGAILMMLAGKLNDCNGSGRSMIRRKLGADNVDLTDLGIVGLKTSTNTTDLAPCDNEPQGQPNIACRRVTGALTLHVKFNGSTASISSRMSLVRYAACSAIENAMKTGYFDGLDQNFISANRLQPACSDYMDAYQSEIAGSGNDSTNVVNDNTNDSTNMAGPPDVPSNHTTRGIGKIPVTRTTILIATLISAVVGIVASLMIFRQVFASKDNCLSPCDGTGVDRDYIDEGHRAKNFRDASGDGKNRSPKSVADIEVDDLDEEVVMAYDIANGLSMIDEDAEEDASSYAMSTSIANHSNMMSGMSAMSVSSEATRVTSNRCRTPQFGGLGRGSSEYHFT